MALQKETERIKEALRRPLRGRVKIDRFGSHAVKPRSEALI